MPDPTVTESLKTEIDRCVKCGLCLPECPTYRLDQTENESPRGRLALIEGYLQGRLDNDTVLHRHLDRCLACRRCERICPSQVRYGLIMDGARSLLGGRPSNALSGWMQNAKVLRWGTRLARALPGGLSRALPGLHRLHRTARALPASGAPPQPGIHAALHGKARGTLGLFAGCTGAALQPAALRSALTLLRHCGYDVSLPVGANCCGAQARHAGDATTAERLADTVRSAFDQPLDAVISIASGCGSMLDEYRPPLTAPHRDVVDFLLTEGDLSPADFRPLPRRVLLHTPCSVENLYRGGQWTRSLLERIPQIELIDVGTRGQCCGAAGDYMLRHPDTAARLRQAILDDARDADATLLVTANVGCALHIADGLRLSELAIEVRHPVEILAEQLSATPESATG